MPFSTDYWVLVKVFSLPNCSSLSNLLVIPRWVFSVVLLSTKPLWVSEPCSVGSSVTGVAIEETKLFSKRWIMHSFNTTINKLLTTFSPFRTEPLDFIVENVTAYSFGVATKWQVIGLKEIGTVSISYELNKSKATTTCKQGDNHTHVFCTIPTMRPKTKFSARFRVCYWQWHYRVTCTDFSKSQTVLTKPAGKASSIR